MGRGRRTSGIRSPSRSAAGRRRSSSARSTPSEVYVYTGSGGAYTEQARLVSPDPNPSNNDGFGNSVAAATNGGSDDHRGRRVWAHRWREQAQGSVYLFAGSGASYPLQIELNDPNPQHDADPSARASRSSAMAARTRWRSAYPTDILLPQFPHVRGADDLHGERHELQRRRSLRPIAYQPDVEHNVGNAVAVGVLNGVTTVAARRWITTAIGDSVYVFAGSGTSYTTTKLTDAGGYASDQFGRSVAVGYSVQPDARRSRRAGLKSDSIGNQADGVLLFTQTGATYTESSLPRSTGQLRRLLRQRCRDAGGAEQRSDRRRRRLPVIRTAGLTGRRRYRRGARRRRCRRPSVTAPRPSPAPPAPTPAPPSISSPASSTATASPSRPPASPSPSIRTARTGGLLHRQRSRPARPSTSRRATARAGRRRPDRQDQPLPVEHQRHLHRLGNGGRHRAQRDLHADDHPQRADADDQPGEARCGRAAR